jgi:hypothetical protein
LKAEIRIKPHTELPGHNVAEVWYAGIFIGQVVGADGPGVRFLTKYFVNGEPRVTRRGSIAVEVLLPGIEFTPPADKLKRIPRIGEDLFTHEGRKYTVVETPADWSSKCLAVRLGGIPVTLPVDHVTLQFTTSLQLYTAEEYRRHDLAKRMRQAIALYLLNDASDDEVLEMGLLAGVEPAAAEGGVPE